MNKIIIGRKYRHFKGHTYTVCGAAKDAVTDEDIVIYTDGTNFWTRTKDDFFADVTNRNPNPTNQSFRFQMISK